MQAHHAVGQHVFFHHIGQVVGGLLAGLGELVQAPRQGLHDPGHPRHHHRHDQGELPVQVEQIDQQRHQREAVARQAQQRLYQQGGPSLDFIDDGIGQGAGRLPGEEPHLGREQPLEHLAAQAQHAFVGDTCQRVLAHELRQAPDGEQAQQGDGNDPQRQGAFGEALVQQGLEQGGHQRLGECPHQGGDDRQRPCQALVAKIHRQPLEATGQRQCR